MDAEIIGTNNVDGLQPSPLQGMEFMTNLTSILLLTTAMSVGAVGYLVIVNWQLRRAFSKSADRILYWRDRATHFEDVLWQTQGPKAASDAVRHYDCGEE